MANIVMAKYYKTSFELNKSSEKRGMRRISALEKKENRSLSRSEKRRILLQERRRLLNGKENKKKEKVYVLTYIR